MTRYAKLSAAIGAALFLMPATGMALSASERLYRLETELSTIKGQMDQLVISQGADNNSRMVLERLAGQISLLEQQTRELQGQMESERYRQQQEKIALERRLAALERRMQLLESSRPGGATTAPITSATTTSAPTPVISYPPATTGTSGTAIGTPPTSTANTIGTAPVAPSTASGMTSSQGGGSILQPYQSSAPTAPTATAPGTKVPVGTVTPPPATAPSPTAGTPGQTPAQPSNLPEQQRPTAAEQSAFDQAFTLLKSGKYEAAINGFSQFLRTYQDSPLAGDAYYWTGEAYFVLGRWDSALRNFQVVSSRFGEGDKALEALMRRAEIYQELKQYPQQRTVLKKIIDRFPGTPQAEKAKTRLEQLEKQQ